MIDLLDTTTDPGSHDTHDADSSLEVQDAVTMVWGPSQRVKGKMRQVHNLSEDEVIVPDSPEVTRGSQDLTKMDVDTHDFTGHSGKPGPEEALSEDGNSPPPKRRRAIRLRAKPLPGQLNQPTPPNPAMIPPPTMSLPTQPLIIKPESKSSSTLTPLDGLSSVPRSPSLAPSVLSSIGHAGQSRAGSPSFRKRKPHSFTLEIPIPPSAIRRMSASPGRSPAPSSGAGSRRIESTVKKKVSIVKEESDEFGSSEVEGSPSPRKRTNFRRIKDEFSDSSDGDDQADKDGAQDDSQSEASNEGTTQPSSDSDDDELLAAALARAQARREEGQAAVQVKADDGSCSPNGLRRSGRAEEVEARKRAKEEAERERAARERRARELDRETVKGRLALAKMVREHKERDKYRDSVEEGKRLMMVSHSRTYRYTSLSLTRSSLVGGLQT